MNDYVILFAKSPFNQDVKTRLAKDIGAEAAQGVYTRLFFETLSKLIGEASDTVTVNLHLAESKSKQYFGEAYPELLINSQCDGSFGKRMTHALESVFELGADRVVLTGSDIPGLDWDLIKQAFCHINDQNIVLGPTYDGGFYLIGMATPWRKIFKNIPWSTPDVLKILVENIKELGNEVFFLPKHRDIDNINDLRSWQASLSPGKKKE